MAATVSRRAIEFTSVAAGGLLALAVVDPNHVHVPLCPFRAMTGAYCPLCGGLRAVHDVTHGAVTAAFHANALLVTALPLAVVTWLLAGRWREDPGLSRAVQRRLVMVVVAVGLAFTVVRNLPFASALRPG